MPFRKVLIANRGVIACRILRTLTRLGIRSVAVYSEADRHAPHVAAADEAYLLGPAPAAQSYLRGDRIIEVARQCGADAIHPGYGFLSENAEFASECEQAGIAFIGPTPDQMRAFGLKHTAREIAQANDVPLVPGTPLLPDAVTALAEAERIGFPVMLKSTAGGGGIGMRLCREAAEVADAFSAVERLGQSGFKQSGTFLEKYVENARHIEVQIFGDGAGGVLALGERDCSVQRRNQKVIEETPAPGITESTRRALLACAIRLGRAVNYRSAGTVEFIYDSHTGQFYFLEVNTRLQVEHGVTEEVCGIDLVEWMVRLAGRDLPPLSTLETSPAGAAIQVRVYAEDPANSFQPSSGVLSQVDFPAAARVETWVVPGAEVTSFYDPLLAKIIVRGETRIAALQQLRKALERTALSGIETNLAYLRRIACDPDFERGGVTTRYLDGLSFQPTTVEVVEGGTFTTVQDYPGRVGFWDVGVPPSGPMDSLAFRLGNRILGNDPAAAGLECTVIGPALRFRVDSVVAITGADMGPAVDGRPVPLWTPVTVRSGSVLELGEIRGTGARTYILVRNGFAVPRYLGSCGTFTLGRFGGHGGRTLRAGDVLHLSHAASSNIMEEVGVTAPDYGNSWRIGVLYGPHGAPDFFTQTDIDTFFATDWKVHYNSSRTGVRLIGPKPQWARTDGGEAGLHPSNLHDNAYAIGTVDFTGDMPVILGPDGPSLGGFVCPATIISAELWKIGQLRPGDTVRFIPLTIQEAGEMANQLERVIESPPSPLPDLPSRVSPPESAIIYEAPANTDSPAIVVRQSGDKYLLIEYGEPVLDLELRFRIHAIMEWIGECKVEGILDITPGIRSIQIHYDSRWLPRDSVLELIDEAEAALPPYEDLTVNSRIVHLPLSWNDPATQLAIDKYQRSVRPDAPWCPSNIEFIRRINGLESQEDVKRIVFDASYLVLGLGDVYLGAPVATPLDPRHRLVTTKYNPARTWTPENAVGIGGAYLCVYGMEGPGGYQFVGRTVQMWNTHRTTADFQQGKPWLLRFFDQIRFYPVTAGELLQLRDDFPQGKFRLQIEDQPFSVREYRSFLSGIQKEAKQFKAKQQAAFEAERQRWAESGEQHEEVIEAPSPESAERSIPAGLRGVRSPTHASVWNIHVKAGDRVHAGARLMILESMKMEIAVSTPVAGIIVDILCAAGAQVAAGEPLIFLRPE